MSGIESKSELEDKLGLRLNSIGQSKLKFNSYVVSTEHSLERSGDRSTKMGRGEPNHTVLRGDRSIINVSNNTNVSRNGKRSTLLVRGDRSTNVSRNGDRSSLLVNRANRATFVSRGERSRGDLSAQGAQMGTINQKILNFKNNKLKVGSILQKYPTSVKNNQRFKLAIENHFAD